MMKRFVVAIARLVLGAAMAIAAPMKGKVTAIDGKKVQIELDGREGRVAQEGRPGQVQGRRRPRRGDQGQRRSRSTARAPRSSRSGTRSSSTRARPPRRLLDGSFRFAARFLGGVAATVRLPRPRLRAREAGPSPGRHGKEPVEKFATFCEMCFWRCGVVADVSQDGRVLRLEGNPDHPLTQGRLCARGNAGTDLLYDPDRLKYPMRRTGKRGEGKFERISWDEALDILADKLKTIREQHGPEAVAFFPHGIGARFMGDPAQGLRHAEQRRAVVRPVPRPARRRLLADLRARARLARAARPRGGEAGRAHRQPPGRERVHLADHPVRHGPLARREADRGRSPLLDRGLEGGLVAADQAGHGHRAAARLDERADRRRPLRQAVPRHLRAGLRGALRPRARVHAGMGRSHHDAAGRRDPRDGASDGGGEARGRGAPGPPRHLVRRRHAARAGDGHPDGAARELRAQGRPVLPDARPARRLRAARLPGPGKGPRRRRRGALPAGLGGDGGHERARRRDADRQALPDQGLDRLRAERTREHPAAAADARGDREAGLPVRRGRDAGRPGGLRRPGAPRGHLPRALRPAARRELGEDSRSCPSDNR